MKKIVCCFLSVLMLLSFAACSEGEPSKETDAPGSSAASGKETFGLNETAVFDDLKFTAMEMTESDGDDFFVPEEGKVFVGVKFTVENISNEEQSISSLLLFEGYVDDIKCDYSLNAACAFDEGTLDGSVAPGKKLVGWYALEVPEDWKNIELTVQSSWLSNKSAVFTFKK